MGSLVTRTPSREKTIACTLQSCGSREPTRDQPRRLQSTSNPDVPLTPIVSCNRASFTAMPSPETASSVMYQKPSMTGPPVYGRRSTDSCSQPELRPVYPIPRLLPDRFALDMDAPSRTSQV